MAFFAHPSVELMFAGAVFLLALLSVLIVKAFAQRQMRRLADGGRRRWLTHAEQILMATRLPFMAGVALLAAISQLTLSVNQEKWLRYGWVILLVSQLALWGHSIIGIVTEQAFERQRAINPTGATHLGLLGLIGRIALWAVAILVILDNLGFNVRTLMASLGIGGIAIALAVQNILGDVFSSVSIALDKPFVIGDFIIVDTYMGSVEYVGMKTTRLRSLGGEQIIFSNSELLKNRIRNYKRMLERRVLFEFGIAYETRLEDIEAVPAMVQEIISPEHFGVRFDRAHFKGYGDSALLFEVVYYVLDPDYNKYMDIQQAINLSLLRQFRERGIAFAYPVRTLHIVPPANAETDVAASAFAGAGRNRVATDGHAAV
ncbi:MAG: mechanosensitive ion channel family protein [Herbaspirillum sp.]|jgi:small-conductance mechanosensitive channel|nr:mechanosensitive ion channel family protein [Herbaspirillum sp.]